MYAAIYERCVGNEATAFRCIYTSLEMLQNHSAVFFEMYPNASDMIVSAWLVM